jgi:hypothetical protein
MNVDHNGRPRTDRQRSCAVVVLGAGRSGTSAITRALAAVGVDLGDRLRPGAGKNPTGFFEDIDMLALNKRLKHALRIKGDSVRLIADEEWSAPTLRALHDDAVETIRRRFGDRSPWGYKYGRTLRLLPFWQEVYRTLDLDVRYVVALRNPMSVARSRGQLDPERGTQEKSDLEWLVNIVPYFRAVRECPFVVVDFDLVMADPVGQLERLARTISLPLNEATHRSICVYRDEFLQPGRRHTVFTMEQLGADTSIHPLVREAYGWLFGLASDEITADSPELWDAWARIESEVSALRPLLLHIDQVQARLTRARRSPLGPLQSVPVLLRWLRNR